MSGSSSIKNLGLLEWSGGRDKELHRTYNVKFLIESDSILDGPQQVTFAPDLPVVGSPWVYGNDNDQYAVCSPDVTCEAMVKREANVWWVLSYEFTTRPWRYCLIAQYEHPAQEPDLISGSFITYQERTCKRRGTTGTGTGVTQNTILSSSLEPIWVGKDKNRPTVSIRQIRINLELPLIASMVDTLNDGTLWGLSSRCVKLRNVPWRRLVWGMCSYYYERTLEFDIKYDTFDETELRDQGHRVLDKKKLAVNPYLDRTDPDNFTRPIDDLGNVHKLVLLNGEGEMCTDPISHLHYIDTVELYDESNFYLLGVPVTI